MNKMISSIYQKLRDEIQVTTRQKTSLPKPALLSENVRRIFVSKVKIISIEQKLNSFKKNSTITFQIYLFDSF